MRFCGRWLAGPARRSGSRGRGLGGAPSGPSSKPVLGAGYSNLVATGRRAQVHTVLGAHESKRIFIYLGFQVPKKKKKAQMPLKLVKERTRNHGFSCLLTGSGAGRGPRRRPGGGLWCMEPARRGVPAMSGDGACLVLSARDFRFILLLKDPHGT